MGCVTVIFNNGGKLAVLTGTVMLNLHYSAKVITLVMVTSEFIFGLIQIPLRSDFGK